jgi:hypothetical protein
MKEFSPTPEPNADKIESKYLKPLVYIEPAVLFELADKQDEDEVLVLELPAKPEQEAVELANGTRLNVNLKAAESLDTQNYYSLAQDGISLCIAKVIHLSPLQQINLRLNKGWFKNKFEARIAEKQQVPGFMGTRDCK